MSRRDRAEERQRDAIARTARDYRDHLSRTGAPAQSQEHVENRIKQQIGRDERASGKS